MPNRSPNSTSAPSPRNGLFAAFRAWLKQGSMENSITREEALEIGRRYYEQQHWPPREVFNIEESAYSLDGVNVPTFAVFGSTRAGDPHIHVRRSDGKVIGVITACR